MFFKKLIKSDLAGLATMGASMYTFEYTLGLFSEKRKADYEKRWLDKGYKKVQTGTTEVIDIVGTCMQPCPRNEPVYVWQKPEAQEQPYSSAGKNSPA